MTRDTFAALVVAWFKSRGIVLAEAAAVEFEGASAPSDAIVPLSDEAAVAELTDLTYLIDDAKRTRTPTPQRTTSVRTPTPPRVALSPAPTPAPTPPEPSRTLTPSRTATTQIPPAVLAAVIAASKV